MGVGTAAECNRNVCARVSYGRVAEQMDAWVTALQIWKTTEIHGELIGY